MRGEAGSSEALLAELLRTGHGAAGARAFLSERELDESRLVGLLHLAVPASFLEAVASTPPWSERPRVLGAVCLNPKAPRALAQRLLPVLYWRDLADLVRATDGIWNPEAERYVLGHFTAGSAG